ncbi:hypothetical protein MMC24_004385 [Lignoscripta atroalba]|nr:hypothetical protein [Lignoscripta atroalba]
MARVDFHSNDDPLEASVNSVVEVLQRPRNSPEPDDDERLEFYQMRREISGHNETSVRVDLTAKLVPPVSQNRSLAFIQNKPWKSWGSPVAGVLPVPQPDLCICFTEGFSSTNDLIMLTSPYPQADTLTPRFPVEVISSMGHTRVSTRQNANNMSLILGYDYIRLKELGVHKDWNKRIRFLSAGHNDSSMWWDGWYFVLDENDEPRWSFRRLAHQAFDVYGEAGFVTVQKYNKNWQDYLLSEDLPALQDEVNKIHLIRNAAIQAAVATAELAPPGSTDTVNDRSEPSSATDPTHRGLPAKRPSQISSVQVAKKPRQSKRQR